MKSLCKNKRGDLVSIVVMIIVVFTLALGAVAFWKVFTEFTSEFKTNPRISKHNKTVDVIETVEDKGQNLLDLLVFMTLVGLMVGVIVSAVYLPSHPVVTGVFIVGMLIAIFLSGIFVNVYDEFTEEPEMTATAAGFTFTNLILGEHLPIILTFLLIVVTIILYGKSRNSGGLP